jgi:hypothetical protein
MNLFFEKMDEILKNFDQYLYKLGRLSKISPEELVGKKPLAIVDQALKKLFAQAEISREYGEYVLGIFRWTYQEQPMKIPILNLKKI